MIFKSFRLQVWVRLGLIILTIFTLSSLYYSNSSFFSKLAVLGIGGLQVYFLLQFLEKTNKDTVRFLEGISYDDLTSTYPSKIIKTKGREDLYQSFDGFLKKISDIRAEDEAQHQYLRTIMQHIGIGIVTFDKAGEIQILNRAAKKILGLKALKNIKQLSRYYPSVAECFLDLKTGGKDLIKITQDDDEVQLAIYAIELSLKDQTFKLISLQNIQSELEEKEMEAWQNLIRVLTHEIMNSVTPISSLASTVETELMHFKEKGSDVSTLTQDTIEDFYLALKTIHNRSESLIKFVSDFRNMTRIKLPNLTDVLVDDLITHILLLLKPDIQEHDVAVEISIASGLCVNVDKEQIEQVLINIVKNALQALVSSEKPSKKLTITAEETQTEGAVITISDNGTGIEEEALKQIFIPFFTTKKNGSGIGLSLSKQIMRNHGGTISAVSEMGIGTHFYLKFAS